MNDSISCIIIDDEQDAIDLLKSRLSNLYSEIVVADEFTRWEQALPALRNNSYDILFIDVSMPGKTGLELLKLVPGLACEIIFVTAHDNFALNAFSFSASGYILKPIDDAELSVAINKSIERIKNKRVAGNPQGSTARLSEKIGVHNNNGIDYVNVEDILYLESENKCTHIVTDDDKFTSVANIGAFKHLTDTHQFFQVHRSFIVNVNCILRYESTGIIIMRDKKEIPLSRNVKNDFLKIFDSK